MAHAEAQVRSVMPRGNGAYIVHAELEKSLAGYALQGCSPYLAAFPGLPHPGLRAWLAEAPVVHLPADLGHVPLPADCRRVITFHNFYTDAENMAQASGMQRLFYRHVLTRSVQTATRSADRIIVVSRFLADCVRQQGLAGNTPVEVIYNGIDTRRFCPVEDAHPDRPLRVLFVGNPSRRKGFHLITALAEHLPEHVELAFTTGLRDEEAKAIHPRLVSLGKVPYADMHRLYQQSDLLLFPTFREGFGLCVAEAMACGLPVVSTACSAIPELITDGQGGYLVQPGDFSALLQRTQQLLANAELRQTMGDLNRTRAVTHFDQARMVREYQDLFHALA